MRKVLSFVLVLALVLSSFSMAFAGETAKAASLSDIAGNANEDAIQVAFDLGIVTGNPDGTFLPDKAVTRAEFAAMLTRALDIPDSALSGYTTTSFKDTAGYSWAVPYLAFCQSKGIMLGDGAGNVMPGRTITVNEAMTMALRAIGYTANSSLLVGVWPANYVSIAQNESLYDDVVAKDTAVNKASAAQIIYNLLTVQKVAVNTDGTTDYLWKNKAKDVESNLLNTNQNCTEIDDAILGSTAGCGYDDSLINITKNLGAYGTAYVNDDKKVVAFTKDDNSAALTGKLNDKKDKFKVGTVEYDLKIKSAPFASSAALFANGDDTIATHGSISINDLDNWASKYSDDGDTVTVNVDLSGKSIKDIYSVVAWKVGENGDADLAASDVQSDIADKSLLNFDFEKDDNSNIDMSSFELVGVPSLDKIKENNALYVYADKDDKIRRVAVGTETVQGVVDELEYDTDNSSILDTVTIGSKAYDVSKIATSDAQDLDTDSEGTFYLDAFGKIYDFDGTSGKADTFGIVEAWDQKVGNEFDNPKVKLYLSDDSEKSFNFSKKQSKVADMDWVLKSKIVTVPSVTAAMNNITNGSIIGYSLNSSGDIKTVDATGKYYSGVGAEKVNFQSSKVLKVGSQSFSIDSKCVVFTYKDNPKESGDYDIANLKDVETGELTSPTAIILNSDDKVTALFTDQTNTTGENYIFGVINTKTSAKDSGGDSVSKFDGLIDGQKFSYKADDVYTAKAGVFDVYRIKLDSSNIITEIKSVDDSKVGEYVNDKSSGWINSAPEKISKLDSDKTVVTTKVGTTENKYTIADNAAVYKFDRDDKVFTAVKLSALKDNGKVFVRLYDTKGKDADGIATLVIFYEE